ncbi:MAG: TauD/TfdA family dioxygenase [Sphingomonas sp.]
MSRRWRCCSRAPRGRAPDAVTRADFAHPLIDDLMKAAKAQLLDGYGAIILAGAADGRHVARGLHAHPLGPLGTYLGEGAVQSGKGDRIGYVRNEPGSTRGYTTDVELRPHTDFHEIMSLAAFSRAESGGVSGLVSGLAIHNRIARERPDLLPALYEGFWHVSR